MLGEETLPIGFLLKKKYEITDILDKGNIGISYIASDKNSGIPVHIREFYPKGWCTRDDKNHSVKLADKSFEEKFKNAAAVFANEAKIITILSEDGVVVKVLDYFLENHTAYLVTEYVDGKPIVSKFEHLSKPYKLDEAINILKTISEPLYSLHEIGLYHCNISLDNIIIDKNKNVRMVDIGNARNYIVTINKSFDNELSKAYAPIEMFDPDKELSPATDVYMLGAVLYELLSCKCPPEAKKRIESDSLVKLKDIDDDIKEAVSDVVSKALAIEAKDRYNTVPEFLNALKKAKEAKELEPFISFLKDGKEKKWKIAKNQAVKVGRSPDDCEIEISGEDISRIHCEICYNSKNKVFVVTDLSSNGTYTKDEIINKNQEKEVEPGQIIYLATKDYVLTLGVE